MEVYSFDSGTFQVPTMTNTLLKKCTTSLGARLCKCLIAKEEPIIMPKTNFLSVFRKNCAETTNNLCRELIGEVTFCLSTAFRMICLTVHLYQANFDLWGDFLMCFLIGMY